MAHARPSKGALQGAPHLSALDEWVRTRRPTPELGIINREMAAARRTAQQPLLAATALALLVGLPMAATAQKWCPSGFEWACDRCDKLERGKANCRECVQESVTYKLNVEWA